MDNIDRDQKLVCLEYGSGFVAAKPNEKVGIASDSLGRLPLNALRHLPERDTCGWYIWGGDDFSEAPDFFQPLHVAHLPQRCPEIMKYLGLAPGWRVLLSEDHVGVWYDVTLLNI